MLSASSSLSLSGLAPVRLSTVKTCSTNFGWRNSRALMFTATVKIGMREFRENLAGYLESGTPLAIMRHGETLGFYIPAQKRNRKAELEAMRAAAKDLDEMIASWGASEDELMDEYKGIRLAAREKKRNAK